VPFILGFVASTLLASGAAALGWQASTHAAQAAAEGRKIAETPAATLAGVALVMFAGAYLLQKRWGK
jgi:hypothetical protein